MDKYYLIALNAVPLIGSHMLHSLLQYYDYDSEYCWQDYRNWGKALGKDSSNLLDARINTDGERVYDDFLRSGASCVAIDDEEYPTLLREIYDPPVLLFYKGILPDEKELCLAMVGSRHATAYGRITAQMLAGELGQNGVSVISGMARGIDTACHSAALQAGAKTYAILGSGIDVIYPRENAKLYEQIIEQGAVISEYPCGAQPKPAHFPRRNRIISGMSKAVIVVEAGEKSGTLITVSEALSQNRDIWAVPGPITSKQSKGTNNLIKQGCKIVTQSEDILQEYADYINKLPAVKETVNVNISAPNLSEEERKIAELLIMPMQFDAIAEEMQMEPAALSACLTMMELKGVLQQLPGKFYIKTSV